VLEVPLALRAGSGRGRTMLKGSKGVLRGCALEGPALKYRLFVLYVHDSSSNAYVRDPELSQWLQDARNSVDPEYRKQLYSKAQKRVIEQVYWLPMFGVKRFYGIHKDLDLKAGLDEVPRFQFAHWKK
jgi:hypothetical protein